MAYKNIHENFWRDREIKALPNEEKLFLIYVITGPHAHVSGIYFLPKAYIVNDLAFSEKLIDRCIDTLSKGYRRGIDMVSIGYQKGIDTKSDEKFILKYDSDKEIIWIRNMLRYQVFHKKVSPKIVSAVRNHLLSLPISWLNHEFSKYYHELQLPFFAPESIPYAVSTQVTVKETVSVSEKESVSNIHAANKQRFLDYVFLTSEEHQRLKEQLNGKTEDYITQLNNYIGQIGVKAAAKKYRSHYHTILNWHSKNEAKPQAGKGEYL